MSSRATQLRRKALKEGTCFKTIRVKSDRVEGEHVQVMAEEIHTMIDPAENFFSSSQSFPSFIGSGSNTRKTFYNMRRTFYEKREIMTVSSFKIAPPPKTYLGLDKTSNGITIIDLKKETRGTAYFPPLALTDSEIDRETSPAEVILGLDPSVGHPWVSPMALRHIMFTREEVISAGGLSVADFDASESEWAGFRTLYIGPKPAKKMYVQKWKVEQGAFECCGWHRAVLPLYLAGGRVFRKGFQPSHTGIADPVLFKSLDAIIEL